MLKAKLFFIYAILSSSLFAKGAAPEIIFIRSNSDSVGLYDKFEIGLNLKAEFINPFNPHEIDISAIFTAPSGKQWNVFGFYNYSLGSVWKVRFAPNETGKWKYTV